MEHKVELRNADFGFRNADFGMGIAECGLGISDFLIFYDFNDLPLTAHRLLLTVNRSPFTTLRFQRLTVYCSPLTVHRLRFEPLDFLLNCLPFTAHRLRKRINDSTD